jgi:predicted alpha/beta superfamily hydrolase
MPIRFLLSALLLLASPARGYGLESSQSPPSPVTVTRSAQHVLESATVGDAFVVQVRLPASYASGHRRYPALYVLDADKCFGLATDTAEWLAWAEEAPEMIVVGIGYGPGRDWWQKRSRDLTPTKDASKIWGEWPMAGGATKFQDFLRGRRRCLRPCSARLVRTTNRRSLRLGVSSTAWWKGGNTPGCIGSRTRIRTRATFPFSRVRYREA